MQPADTFAERVAEMEKEAETLKKKLAALHTEREILQKELKNAINQTMYYDKLLKDMRKMFRPLTMKELLLRM
ncbi:MAG: hypothetical protein N3F63_02550 [Thermoplasmata archaeon]|nr:hypothetical protein [Thermoplasmata archaeon]